MCSCKTTTCYDVSRQAKDAMDQEDWAEVAHILSKCNRRDSDSFITQLISQDQWDAVRQVIRCIGDEERTWEIVGVLVKNNILLSVAKGNWREIGELPHERFLHSTLDWILQQACTRAKQTEIVQYVLPHCEDDQMDSALQQLVTHGLWFAAGRMLQRCVDDERARWVIQKACQQAGELAVRAYVICFCPENTFDFLLTELVARDMWRAVARVLMRGVSDTAHCWTLRKACSRTESWPIKHIMLYCTNDHCSSVLTDFVSEGQWGSVGKLLNCMSNGSVTVTADEIRLDNNHLHLIVSKNWIGILALLAVNTGDSVRVQEWCKGSKGRKFGIYQRHNDMLRPVVLDKEFTRGYEEKRFPRYVRKLQSVFVVTRDTVSTCQRRENIVCIIPQCAGHQLDSVFKQWFDNSLQNRSTHESMCNISGCQDMWTVRKLDVNPTTSQTTVVTSSSGTKRQKGCVLRHVLIRHVWWALGKVLEQGLDDSSVTQILKETLLYDDDQMMVEHVLPHCTDSQIDLAVTELVSAGQWMSVTKLVQGVGDRKETWTVEGTSVDRTLLQLVAGGGWRDVGGILRRGIDEAQFRWAFDTAILYADDRAFSKHVLSLVADYDRQSIDSVLAKLISEGMWRSVNKILELDGKQMWLVNEISVDRESLHLVVKGRWQEIGIKLAQGVDDSLQNWLTLTASADASSTELIEHILPHCSDDQLDSMLITLIDQCHWRAVGEVLNREVTQRQWAVEETCMRYNIEGGCASDFNHDDGKHLLCDEKLYDIVSHCTDDQMDWVLETLVKRNFWGTVEELFKRGVNDSQRLTAVENACKLYTVTIIKKSVLHHCAEDIDSVLKILVERGLWRAVEVLFGRGVTMSQKQWTVQEACDHYSDRNIAKQVIRHCADDQLDSVLTTLVTKGKWRSVEVLFRQGVTISQKQWAVGEACSNYSDRKIAKKVLHHCANDQLDSVLTTLVTRGNWRSVEVLLNRGVSISQKQWAVNIACEHGKVKYDYIIKRIVSHCAADQLDSVLTTLVKRRMWGGVAEMLEQNVSDHVKQWAVQKACDHGQIKSDNIIQCIVIHCAHEKLDSVLTTLVERRLWQSVGEVLERGVKDAVKQWAVKEACEHAKAKHKNIITVIESHCTDDQLDYVLTTLVERRLWETVGKMLKRDVSDSVKRLAVTEACKHDTACNEDVMERIVSHCDPDQLDSVLTTLVERRMWWAAEKMLKRDVSDSVKLLAVTEACKHGTAHNEDVIKRIVSHCDPGQLESVLTSLVERRLWGAAGEMLERGVSVSVKQWAVQEASIKCHKYYYLTKKCIFWHCAADQRDSVLTTLVERRIWRGVQEMLERGVSDSVKQWAVKEACEHGKVGYEYTITKIVCHCAEDQLDSALTKLVERRLWGSVVEMLKRGVSDFLKQWAVKEACEHGEAKDDNTIAKIVSHCAADTRDSVLTTLVERRLWVGVEIMLSRGVSDYGKKWAVREACKHGKAKYEEIIGCIVSHCHDEQLDSVLTILVERRWWETVLRMLERGVSDSVKQWAVREASAYGKAKYENIITCIVALCAADQRDSVLTTLVERRLWKAVEQIFEPGVSDCVKQWAVKEACELIEANNDFIIEQIVSHCAADQRDSVLKTLVERRLWQIVLDVLHRGVSVCMKQWAVEEACNHCKNKKEYYVVRIVPHCAADQRDSLMTTLVERRLWEAVGVMFTQGVSDTVKQWAVKEASKKCHEFYDYTRNSVFWHCAADQRDSVLTTLVERRIWRGVHEVLERGVSDSVKQWAVKAVFKNCIISGTYDGNDTMLSYCADEQLDSLLTTLVERRLWRAVEKVLKRRVSDSVKQWAVKEACEHAKAKNEKNITSIVCHCADEQRDSVLTTLVERRLWEAVEEVMKQGVSDSVKQWAVKEACKHVDANSRYFTRCIFAHCADDQLVCVMKTLVERRLWFGVEQMLKRGVSDSVKQWAVKEACEHVEVHEDCLIEGIISHCSDDQLDSVLTQLVKRRLWKAVGEMLKRNPSSTVKQWAVLETCKYNDTVSADSFMINNILPHCAGDELDVVLTTLVERRLWQSVVILLQRKISDFVKQWAVTEACKFCDAMPYSNKRRRHANDFGSCDRRREQFIINNILPHCAHDQRDSVLSTLVERRLWKVVGEVVKQGVSDSVKQWALIEACQHCDIVHPTTSVDSYIVENILSKCADGNLDFVLTPLIERHLWLSTQHVLVRVACHLETDFAGQKTCEHCRSAEVYFINTIVSGSNGPGESDVTPHCADDTQSPVTSTSTTRDVCTSVRNVMGREVSDAHRRESIKAAFQYVDENTLIKIFLPHYVYDSTHSALKVLASRGFWSAFLLLLHYCIIDTLHLWAVAKGTESKEGVFWDMVRHPSDGVKELAPSMWRSINWSGLQRSLKQLIDWNTPLCEVLCESLLGSVREIWLSGREEEINVKENTVMQEALLTVERLHQQVKPVLMECKTYHVSNLIACTEGTRREYAEKRSEQCFLFPLYMIKYLLLQYHKRKAWEQMTNAILVALTTVPVVPDVQSVAVRVMLRHNRWDIVRHACLSGVCEQDRRQLFQAAVNQRQWSAVKRWADHTLYDDQRCWALGEARHEKRWDVYLKLAEHGLSEWERVGVLFRLTMHADWKMVRHILITVADVKEMMELMVKTSGVLATLGEKKYKQRMSELLAFEKNLTNYTNTLRTLKAMVKRGKWWVVLHNIRHKPNLQHTRLALKAAVSNEAWHAVMQLVRLETDVTRRDSLLRDMVRLQQWGVCRELLEQGVSSLLCIEILSQFMQHHQWLLVAMLMGCPKLDDKSRTEIMHEAIMMREGSVVWQCILKMQTHVSVEERENMFQLAFSREVWQAVKPLLEIKDVTGIRHRDTALLEAIEQHQWDVVDHCQRHDADIDMKDDDGHTPIHRAARKEDWEAVKELTVRGGDPNLLDNKDMSLLNRAIEAEQLDAVKLLIQYHGDIHLAARKKPSYHGMKISTPLGMLIDKHQGEAIETTLMWCPDQWKGVNYDGQTTLHAVCLSGWLDTMYHLIARKVDPLAVRRDGHTAMCYAVMCKDCPKSMVAECIRLGFSTHQPLITDTAKDFSTYNLKFLTEKETRLFISPVVLAVMRGMPVVTQMLYESGACSNRQLFEINMHLTDLTDPVLPKGQEWHRQFFELWCMVHHVKQDPDYDFDTHSVQQSADYLRQACSTPRSLVSTCRLVISHCLTLRKLRHRDIAQLPLSPMMKDYVKFTDLTDPHFPNLGIWKRNLTTGQPSSVP